MTTSKRDWSKLPECDVLDNFCIDRLRKGLQTNIMVTGLGGSGKSSFGVRMGERLTEKINNGKRFNSKDIVDSFLKFLERLQTVDRLGEVIQIEEVSVLFPSKSGMTTENVSLGKILDVLRKKQTILISNAPIWKTIDSHMRAMGHVLVECKGVLKDKGIVVAKAWRLKTDPHTGITYRYPFRRNGGAKVRLFYSKKYDDDIWEEYEKDKDAFIGELINNLKKKIQIKLLKESKEISKLNFDKLPKNQQRVVDFWKQGIYKGKEMAEKMQVGSSVISRTIKSLSRRGIFPEQFNKKDDFPKKN